MESCWLQSLESSLRKEPHPDVKRTVHIIPHNETRDEFMSRHLVELENDGIGKFSSVKKRGTDQIQWRCERANKCKGKSSSNPTTTRASSCGAYVSFTFVSKNTFNICIVRLLSKHSGHDRSNPRMRGYLRSHHTPCTTFAQIHTQHLITTNLTATASNNTTTTTSSTTTTTTSNTAGLTHSSLSAQHIPAHPSSSSTQHTCVPVKPSSSSTQHSPPAAPAASRPKIFKEIWSILPLSSGGKKKRCKITVEELARRVGPPEYMSFSSLATYLRTDNNVRRELQAQLEDVGIKPTEFTAEMSLFSRLCEEEVDALCESLAGLVRDHLPFQGLHVIPETKDEVMTLGRLSEFRSQLRRAIAAIKERVEAVDLASHGFMSKMLDIILSVFEKCLDNQMSKIC